MEQPRYFILNTFGWMVSIMISGGTDVGLAGYVGCWVCVPMEDDTKMTITMRIYLSAKIYIYCYLYLSI